MTSVRNRTAQSSLALRPSKAARTFLVLVLLGVMASAVRAQTVQIRNDNELFLTEPGGTRIGRLAQGASFSTGTTRGAHTQVTIEGWVFRSSLEGVNRDGHTLRVTPPEENVRAEPNGRIVARLVEGALLDEVERRGAWVRVRRAGWMATPRTETARQTPPRQDSAPARAPARTPAATPPARAAAPAAEPPRQATRTPGGPVEAVDPRRAVVRRRLQLFRAPDSNAVGYLEGGLPVRITARAGGWVRIETQGWVRESEIRLSDAAILTGVTAAELRAAPDEFRGRLLRWTIQFIALQVADDLRTDFPPGQRYVLARGPAPEYAFVYVVIPADKLAEVQRLEPLASVTIVARVVSGRSTYLANPILELVDLTP